MKMHEVQQRLLQITYQPMYYDRLFFFFESRMKICLYLLELFKFLLNKNFLEVAQRF